MKKPLTMLYLKNLTEEEKENTAEALEIPKEKLVEIGFFRLIFKSIKAYFKLGMDIEKRYEKVEKLGQELLEHQCEDSEIMNDYLEGVKEFNEKGIDAVYETSPIYDEIEITPDRRRIDLEQYFSQERLENKTGVYVFRGETEEKLILLQIYYAPEWEDYQHVFWRGLATDADTSIMRQDNLRLDAEFWGRKEWVQKQVDKVEDEGIRNKLKEYTYQTILGLGFAVSGDITYVTYDSSAREDGSKIYTNIKLD